MARAMNRIVKILIERDGLSQIDAEKELEWARRAVELGENPEEVLLTLFSLEPDYVLDLLK